MDQPSGLVRHIAWRELFPWLILLRTFRIAIAPTLLAVATAAVLVTPLGWWVAGKLFGEPPASQSYLRDAVPSAPRAYFPSGTTGLLDAYFDLAEPFRRAFNYQLTLGETAYYVFGALWTLVIWVFPGAFVTRRAVVQLATDVPPDLGSTTLYVARRIQSYLVAPLWPVLGISLLAAPIVLLGLPLRYAPGLGTLFVGLCWVFIVLAGIVAMWLVGGLMLGWPLMWPTISAERDGDSFEAFSRSYSYVYGKPLHYFFYVVVAAALGALGWAVVVVAAQLVQEFGFWALSWGAGTVPTSEIRQAIGLEPPIDDVPDHGPAWRAGVALIGLFIALIRAVSTAFMFTFFFTAASAIYLLLRYDVDQKEMDEVFQESELITASPPATAPPPPDAPVSEAGLNR